MSKVIEALLAILERPRNEKGYKDLAKYCRDHDRINESKALESMYDNDTHPDKEQ